MNCLSKSAATLPASSDSGKALAARASSLKYRRAQDIHKYSSKKVINESHQCPCTAECQSRHPPKAGWMESGDLSSEVELNTRPYLWGHSWDKRIVVIINAAFL